MVYVIQVCWQLASRNRTERVPSWSCSQAVSKSVWHIPLLCVQWKTPDDGHRNCPKHVEFYSKNKFEKLVHLVGFIIRIQHASRIPSCDLRGNWRRMMLLVPVQYSFSVNESPETDEYIMFFILRHLFNYSYYCSFRRNGNNFTNGDSMNVKEY